MAARTAGGGISPFKLLLQFALVIVALLLWECPLLQPLKLMVVLIHEMSHGLMALATGGSVQGIMITPNEGGACHTTGGSPVLIISSGYLGSMFFGGLILTASRSRSGSLAVYAILGFVLFGAAFTVVQDGYSRRFALGIAGAAILIATFTPGFLSTAILRAVGTVSCLYSLVDIYNDVLSRSAQASQLTSDASALAAITGIHPTTIGAGWLVVSLFYFLITLKSSIGDRDDDGPPRRRG